MAKLPAEIISFKVDQRLSSLLKRVRNRSEFIRAALIAALDDSCPLCAGTGLMRPEQRRIWEQFVTSHPMAECGRCHETVFTCDGKAVRHACGR